MEVCTSLITETVQPVVFPDRFRLGSPAKRSAIEPYAPATECDLEQNPKQSYESKGLHIMISILEVTMRGRLYTACQVVAWSFPFSSLVYTTAKEPRRMEGSPIRKIAVWCRANPARLVWGCEVGWRVKIPNKVQGQFSIIFEETKKGPPYVKRNIVNDCNGGWRANQPNCSIGSFMSTFTQVATVKNFETSKTTLKSASFRWTNPSSSLDNVVNSSPKTKETQTYQS